MYRGDPERISTILQEVVEQSRRLNESPITRSDLQDALRHYATQADLERAKNQLIVWVVGTAVAVSGLIVGVLKLFPSGS